MAKPNPNKNKNQGGRVNYSKQNRQKEKAIATDSVGAKVVSPTINSLSLANNELNITLTAYDTWFFRESRPHDAVGASELSSLFPPPIRTVAGALRTLIGDQLKINWQTLQSATQPDFNFVAELGDAKGLGELQINGPWINFKGQCLYPAPLYLMKKEHELKRLAPGSVVRCDLGSVRLPTLPEGSRGFKALEQRWITVEGMRRCLEGLVPTDKIYTSDDLFSHEARLGIARDNVTRSVEDGKLYQTQHLRLKDEVSVGLWVKNLSTVAKTVLTQPNTLLRLGGEGRMAALETQEQAQALPFVNAKANAKVERFVLHFLTPADFEGEMFPKGFKKTMLDGETVWEGVINTIEVRIVSAVLGKVHREGGWDMQKHQPSPVKSYIPSGSAWFCRAVDSELTWETLNTQLHGHCIGVDGAYGRGQVLLGTLKDNK